MVMQDLKHFKNAPEARAAGRRDAAGIIERTDYDSLDDRLRTYSSTIDQLEAEQLAISKRSAYIGGMLRDLRTAHMAVSAVKGKT